MTKSISFCGADHSWKILTLLLIASMSFEKLLIFFKTYFLLLYFSSVLRKEKKNPPANAGDVGSIPGSGRSPGE